MRPAERLRLSIVGHLVTLTLDCPAKRNALDLEAWEALGRIDEWCPAGARVLVVRGAGGTFCAGADIAEFETVRRDAASARSYEAANERAFDALAGLPFPTVAAIDGICFGGGFGIAAACDLRVAHPGARFAIPAARLGLAYPVGAMARLGDVIGEPMAKAMLFTARAFDQTAMSERGFLLDVSDDAVGAAMALAGEIAALAPLTHRATKAALAARTDADRNRAAATGDATFESHDYAEGRAAFREKRKPVFEGR